MSNEIIFTALGEISGDLVADAAITAIAQNNMLRPFHWKTLVAACLTIISKRSIITRLAFHPSI